MFQIMRLVLIFFALSHQASFAQSVDAEMSLEIMTRGEIIATAEGEPINNPRVKGFIDAAPTMYFVVRYSESIFYCAVGVIDARAGAAQGLMVNCLEEPTF